MCQYWYINCNKCTILVSDVNNRKLSAGVWTSVPSPQFFCESITVLKNSQLFKKGCTDRYMNNKIQDLFR